MEASRVARPGAIVVAGWLVLLVYAYPGQMTAEAFELLRQARTKFYEPANPPALAAVWRYLELVVAGPMAMFLTQSAAFAAGSYLLLRRAWSSELRAAWLTAGMLVAPPILAPLAVISATSMMTGWLVLGTAFIASTSRGVQLVGLGAMLVATVAQPMGLVATLPLVVLLLRWRPTATGVRRLGPALVAWSLVTIAALGATKHYTKRPTPIASYVTPGVNRAWPASDVPRRAPTLPVDALRLGVPIRTTSLQDGATSALAWIAERTPLLSPWLFFGLCVLFVPLALRAQDLLGLALAMSGITFQVAFRGSMWPAACAGLGGLLVLGRWRARDAVAGGAAPASDVAPHAMPQPRMTAAAMISRIAAALTPGRILVAGWGLLVLYAHPGYMSYDSVLQLLQARTGEYTGGHPPMMGVVWGALDALIPGPLAMLLVQVTCFMAGAYLLLRRVMSARAAALATVAICGIPPVSAVLAVIWKDSQMAAYLALGTALLIGERRATRLLGLALLFLATAMRYNALAITLPLVALLFLWDPRHRWFVRYPLAVAAWGVITLAASITNARLASDAEPVHVWHESSALLDITGTLRYAVELDDAQLRAELVGTPLTALAMTTSPQAIARGSHRVEELDAFTVSTFGSGTYVPALWVTTRHLFDRPTRAEQRAAISRAWRSIVLGHLGAYLAYRWRVTQERLHLGDADIPSATYVWFTDVTNIATATVRTGHNAVPSKLQHSLQDAMLQVGTSGLFRPWIYLVLALVLVPFARRQREARALLLSGLANEALLFVVAPTIDYRYSIWLVVTTVVGLAMIVAKRAWPVPARSSPGMGEPAA